MKELGRQRKNLKDDVKRQKYKRVMGSFAEGHGYADKRKRKTVNRYMRLQRKASIDKIFRQRNQDDEDLGNPGINQSAESSRLSQEHDAEERLPTSFSSNERESAEKLVPAENRASANKRWKGPSKHRFTHAQNDYQQKVNKKEQRDQAILEEQMKRESALKNYKKNKVERNKKFNQKSKRGQPIMKHQIDFLLEKIKAQGD